ncbi:hypothetical protein KI387_008958, partial [Taxus chinensis]
TAQEWRELIRWVCMDTLLIPLGKTRAELTKDIGQPLAADRHTDVFAPIWREVEVMNSLHTQVTTYETTEHLM